VPAAETTGLPGLRPHDLRHTAASFLIRRGASIRLVAEQLGHSTPVVTLSVYSHLYDGDLDRLYDGIDGGPAKSSVDQMWTRAGRPSADGGAHPI
jgi:integrase